MSIKKIKKTGVAENKKKSAKAVPAAKSTAKPAKKAAVKVAPVKSVPAKKSASKPASPVSQKSLPASKIPAATIPSHLVATPKIEAKPLMNKPKTPSAPIEPVVAKDAVASVPKAKPKPKVSKKILDDDLPLDLEEKEDLFEEEKQELAKALREDEEDTFDASFIPTDTSERYILVVDEEGKRRNETVTIISQILPNAIVEVADDPEEASEIMQDCDFDTFVVNFLMPGYSASPFVKSVANHFEHPLLLGFAADKISDAVDPKKGLKIIPLKRLFDLDANLNGETPGESPRG
jgi:hypothetical protein